jgi:hypothetical protein
VSFALQLLRQEALFLQNSCAPQDPGYRVPRKSGGSVRGLLCI